MLRSLQIAGSRAFKNMIMKGEYEKALAVARAQVENGAQVLDFNFDEGLLDGEMAMKKFLFLSVSDPDITRVPIMIDSSKFHILEAGLKVNIHTCYEGHSSNTHCGAHMLSFALVCLFLVSVCKASVS